MPIRFKPSMAYLGLVFAGLMCSLPFLNPWHFFPITSFYEEWLAFLLGTLMLLALILSRPPSVELRLPQTLLWMLSFAAVLLLQMLFQELPYRQNVLIGLIYVLWAGLMVVAGDMLRNLLGLATVIRGLTWCIVAAALLSALLALPQFYHVDTPLSALLANTPGVVRAVANLGQPNLLSNLLVLGIAGCIYLRATQQLSVALFVLVVALLLAGVSLSVSRIGGLLVGWLLVAAWWMQRRVDAEISRRLLRAALYAVVVFAGLQALIFGFDILPAQHAQDMTLIGRSYEQLGRFDVGERVYSTRVFLWQQAWQIFLAHPLFGVGWGQFPWAMFSHFESWPGMDELVREPYAHNLLLQLLAETGLVGTVPVVAALALWLWRRTRDSSTPEAWWLVTLAGIELIHSMVEFPLWYSPFLGLFALVLGLGESRWVAPEMRRFLPVSVVAMTVFSAVILTRTWIDYSRLWTWLYVALGVRSEKSELVQNYTDAVLGQLGGSLLVAYADLPASSVIGIDRVNLRDKILFHERVMRFCPTPQVVYRHVLLLALGNNEREAVALLEHAMRVYPNQIGDFLKAASEIREVDLGVVPKVVQLAQAAAKADHTANPLPH